MCCTISLAPFLFPHITIVMVLYLIFFGSRLQRDERANVLFHYVWRRRAGRSVNNLLPYDVLYGIGETLGKARQCPCSRRLQPLTTSDTEDVCTIGISLAPLLSFCSRPSCPFLFHVICTVVVTKDTIHDTSHQYQFFLHVLRQCQYVVQLLNPSLSFAMPTFIFTPLDSQIPRSPVPKLSNHQRPSAPALTPAHKPRQQLYDTSPVALQYAQSVTYQQFTLPSLVEKGKNTEKGNENLR